MHNAAYQELSLPFTYVPFALTEHQIPAAIVGMRALGIRGFGVSMPFKLSVMPHLDRVEPHAAAMGAVNTIVNTAGELVGHNTDALGAVGALSEVMQLAGARALILGAGGAARAVAYGLCDAGAVVYVANRDAAKARQLVKNIREANICEPALPVAVSLETLALDSYDVVINATSVGMQSNPGCPVEPQKLSSRQIVMDIVYKPLVTEWLAACRARGLVGVDGGRMLLHQAAGQFALYTGVAAPLSVMEQALSAFL